MGQYKHLSQNDFNEINFYIFCDFIRRGYGRNIEKANGITTEKPITSTVIQLGAILDQFQSAHDAVTCR